jgi:hypothetical protein
MIFPMMTFVEHNFASHLSTYWQIFRFFNSQ